jgi:GNAT superfamily N-acetyltransferase
MTRQNNRDMQNYKAFTPVIEVDNLDAIKEALKQGLRDYNYNFFGSYELNHFAITIRNELEEVIAGVQGFIVAKHRAMRLELVWVKEEYRKKGLGAKLFKAVDNYACAKDCKYIQVSTMDFQGQGFYEKVGYKCIGRIPKWFCDRDEIYLLRELTCE